MHFVREAHSTGINLAACSSDELRNQAAFCECHYSNIPAVEEDGFWSFLKQAFQQELMFDQSRTHASRMNPADVLHFCSAGTGKFSSELSSPGATYQ